MAMMNIISADNNDNHTNENTCNIYIYVCMIIPCQSKHFFSSLKLAARQFSMLRQIRKVCSKLVYIPVYHIPHICLSSRESSDTTLPFSKID